VNKKSSALILIILLLLVLSSNTWAGCKSDCKDEYESEVKFCKSSHDDPDDSDRLTKCLENAKDKFPLAAGIGTVYRCMVNNKPVFTDEQLNSSCKLLNIPAHSADPEEVARRMEENQRWAEERGGFIRALEAEQAAARAARPRELLIPPREDDYWETWRSPTNPRRFWFSKPAPRFLPHSFPPSASPAPTGVGRNPSDNFQRSPPDNFQFNPPK
jgi:hypothetical protein